MAQTTSDLWKELLAMNGTTREYAFDINGTWYGPDEDAEVSHSVNGELYSEFGIGNAASAKLSLIIWADDIPKGSTIKRYVRLRYGDQVSEWLPKGVFYSSRRADDDRCWSVDAFDALRKADVEWEPDASLSFPMSMPDAVAEFCRILGVELDDRTVLNDMVTLDDGTAMYSVDYPSSGTTIRNELCWIAAAHGGNFIMTDTGALRLVPLVPSGDVHNVDLDVVSFEDTGIYKPISRVTLRLDSTNSVTAGDDTGREISAMCPTATQDMAFAVLAAVLGYEYQAYSAGAAALDPAAELGDIITVSGVASVVASVSDDGNGFPDVSAPGEAELEEDDPYISPMQQEINRQAAQTRTLFEKSNEAIRASVTSVSNRVTQLELSDGQVLVSIEGEDGTLTTTMDAGDWEVLYKTLAGEVTSGLYFDFTMGRFVFDGTGVFRSKDGNTYIEIVGNELVMYSKDEATGGFLDKIHLGFMSGDSPSSSGGTIDYPYMLLGKASGDVGTIKKFYNGLWIGNSVPINATGNFTGMDGASGIFVNTLTATTYVVNGTDMQNVYTGEAIAKFG